MFKDNQAYTGDASNVSKSTPFAEIDAVLTGVENLTNRINSMVNRLVGSEPPPPSSGGTNDNRPMPSALFPALSDGAHIAHNMLVRAQDDLDRLERMLP